MPGSHQGGVTVGTYAAIGEVGETLIRMLRERLSEHWGSQVNDTVILAAPSAAGEDDSIWMTLYLYRVAENPHRKNDRRQERDGEFAQPPLALDLYYLLTSYPVETDTTNKTEESVKQHAVLGEAMQTMQDNAILRGATLSGSLSADREVRIVLDTTSMDELLSVWNTFEDRPYQPSAVYQVGPIFVQSERTESLERVRRRRVDAFDTGDGDGDA